MDNRISAPVPLYPKDDGTTEKCGDDKNPHIVLLGWAAALVFPALVLVKEAFLILSTPGWLLVGGGLPALTVQLLLRPVYARLENTKPMEDTTYGNRETETHL